MASSFAQVRQAIKTKVETVAGFKLVPLPPSYFRRIQNTIAHKGFTVDMPTSNDEGERMRRGLTYVTSNARVIFAYRLRPKDIITDYDLCMDAEEDIINAVLGTVQDMQIRYNRSNREVSNSMEYMITTIDFTILHTITN